MNSSDLPTFEIYEIWSRALHSLYGSKFDVSSASDWQISMNHIGDYEYYHENEYENARGQYKVGYYEEAAEALKKHLDFRYSRRFRSLNRALFDREDCLEQLGREEEVYAMYVEAVNYYTRQMTIVGDKLATAVGHYFRRYNKVLDVDFAKNETYRLETLVELLKEKARDRTTAGKLSIASKRRRLGSGKLDPFSRQAGLPTEIIQRVLGYVYDDFDLELAGRVCQNWHRIVVTHSDLYCRPEFGGNVGLSDVTKYLKNCKRYGITHIPHMKFNELEYGQENAIIRRIKESRLRVDSLEIGSNSLSFNSLGFSNALTGNSFETLHTLSLTFLPGLSSNLDQLLRFLPALRHLSITFDGRVNEHAYSTVAFNRLDSFSVELSDSCNVGIPIYFLQLCLFDSCRDLTLISTSLKYAPLRRLFRETRPENVCLKRVDIEFRRLVTTMDEAGIRPKVLEVDWLTRSQEMPLTSLSQTESSQAFRDLTTLKLGNMNNLRWAALCDVLDWTTNNLKVIEIDGSGETEEKSHFTFSGILHKCPELETLKITDGKMFGDTHCAELGEALKITHSRLKHLTISCECVTDEGIRSLFDDFSMPQLELTLQDDSFDDETIRFLRSHCDRVLYGHKTYCGFSLPQEV